MANCGCISDLRHYISEKKTRYEWYYKIQDRVWWDERSATKKTK